MYIGVKGVTMGKVVVLLIWESPLFELKISFFSSIPNLEVFMVREALIWFE